LVDELWSGVAVSGASSVERELALSHWGYLTFAYALPLAAAAVLETGTALLSDVWSRARLIVLGQAVLAASLFLTAWTSSPWGLTLGLALAGAASGVACGAAQGLLFLSSSDTADRVMVRWSLYCAIGDVFTPLATATAIATGHSYRAAMGAVAVVVSVQCGISLGLLSRAGGIPDANLDSQHEGDPESTDGEAEPVFVALVRALRFPRLWGWLFAAASCTLLDELIVALAVLRLARDRAASSALAAAAAVTFSLGSIIGAALTDIAVARTSARSVLLASASLTAAMLLVLLVSGGAPVACAALLLVGVACAPHHPLAMAQAYGAIPERPGTVQAVGQIFVVIDIAAPLALGAVADRFGLDAAIGCLLIQPAIIAVCSVLLGRTPPRTIRAISGPRR
jgi:FSR family fosmidomycin resistance protein-like MFS transporter